MNGAQLVDRYVQGRPLTRDERAALAKQLKSAPAASQAISMAKAKAAEACHEWVPAEPRVGWVAYAYIKFVQVWRVYRNDEIVAAYRTEDEARSKSAQLAEDANAEWRGKIPDPRRNTVVKHRQTPTDSRETHEGVMQIELTGERYALVDGEDYARLAGHLWHCTEKGYASRVDQRNGKQVRVLMHREIMNPPDDMEIDHINGNTLDNRRCNLRIATRQQNAMNQKQPVDSASPYKGVYLRKDIGRWQAHIQVGKQKMYLGQFDTAEEGARAYNEAAKKHHGVFARLNEL